MQYITLYYNNKISAVADWQFPGSIPAKEEVVRNEEGQYVFKSALDEAHEQAIREQRELDAKKHEILTALDALDAKGARAARAVALAWANGDDAAGADVEKLAVLEEEAQALRAELAELPKRATESAARERPDLTQEEIEKIVSKLPQLYMEDEAQHV